MVNCLFIWAVTAAAFGSGFQHGYNTGVVNAPQDILEKWIETDGNVGVTDKQSITMMWSLIVSVFCIGGILGGAMTGVMANGLGRKGALLANNFLAIAAGLAMGLSKSLKMAYLLIAGRFIVGINCGLNAGLAPMYLNEISSNKIRGSIGSLYQLAITVTIMISQMVGLEEVFGTAERWPYLFYLIIIPAVYQFLAMLMSPESPKYYLDRKENDEKAHKATDKLSWKKEDADEFYQEVKKEVDASKALPKVTCKDMLGEKHLRKPLFIICFLMIAQQLSGINAVMFYSTKIFNMANFSASAARMSTVGVGIVNVLTTIVSVYLVEACGRKILLLIGFAGMCACTSGLMAALFFVETNKIAGYMCITLVYVYVIFFATGAGSIPWLLGPELFNTAARPLAVSIAVPTNWIFNFVVGVAFLPIQELLGPLVFAFFIVFQIIAFLFIWMFVPETKNKPIEEITALFM